MSELPEPPIPVSEIGPIPPPPMFSTPSPTMIAGRPHMQIMKTNGGSNLNLVHQQQLDYNDYDYEDQDDNDHDELDSEEEYMFQLQQQQQQQNIDTMRVEEIPVKEPVMNAVPKKSALKKKGSGGSGASTPSSNSDASNRPLVVRQDNNSSMK